MVINQQYTFLAGNQLTTSILWPYSCTVHVNVVIHFCDSIRSFWLEANLCRFLSLVYICFVVSDPSLVYICFVVSDPSFVYICFVVSDPSLVYICFVVRDPSLVYICFVVRDPSLVYICFVVRDPSLVYICFVVRDPSLVYICLVVRDPSLVYICLVVRVPIIKKKGLDPINRFKPATCLWLYKASTWISNVIYRSFLNELR
jgi:hypothetical protein